MGITPVKNFLLREVNAHKSNYSKILLQNCLTNLVKCLNIRIIVSQKGERYENEEYCWCKDISCPLIWGLPLLLLMFSTAAHSEFPEKSITMLISFDPGSTTDILGRAIGMTSERYLNTHFIYENRGGGGGTVALGVLSATKPDGYTISVIPSDSVVYTPLMQKVPFKPLKSFTPIIGFSAAPHTALIVKPDAPWKSFSEFVNYAKKNPRKIHYSTAGVGTVMPRHGVCW